MFKNFTLIELIIVITIIALLASIGFKAFGQETAEYEILVPPSPGSSERIPIRGPSPDSFYLENFYEKSKETGLYPTFGWTGEYYETGVTHGSVEIMYDPIFERGSRQNGSDNVYTKPATVVPEPSGLCYLLLFGLELIRRRR